MTPAAFLAAYRSELECRYSRDPREWRADTIEGRIAVAERIFAGEPGFKRLAGDVAFHHAWTAIGGAGRVRLGKLRGLE